MLAFSIDNQKFSEPRMYSFLEGKLVEKNPAYVVLEVNGIGYFLNISLQTFSVIKDAEIHRLLTHLLVREDALTLYGFATEKERLLFRHLISVSGIGANTARLILSSLNSDELQQIILNGDVAQLQKIKGIGTKTAQRVIIDLKDKLGKSALQTEFLDASYNSIKNEALSGLTILGFNKNLAEKALDKILSSKPNSTQLSVEQLIKDALKYL